MTITVHQLVTGRWKENCYLVVQGTQALLVDPGDDMDAICAFVTSAAVTPLAILSTHAHYDHIGAVSALQSRYGIPFYLHAADTPLLRQMNFYRKLFGGSDAAPCTVPVVDNHLNPQHNPLCIGDFVIHVHATPGHTPGSVCLQIGDHLFTGDTLLREKVGRVDFPGGDPVALRASLDVLRTLPPTPQVYPGHGAPTTLAHELAHNPCFQEDLSRSASAT